MSQVVETVDVAVPVRTAYNQWTQFEEFPAFMNSVREIRQLDDTRLHWVVEFGGVRREFDARITEQHPDERVAWTSTEGPKHAGVVTFHRLDDTHSRVTAQLDIDPEGFVENVADKVGIVDRLIKADMANFREFIEHRGTETGAWRGDVEQPGAGGPSGTAPASGAVPSGTGTTTATPSGMPSTGTGTPSGTPSTGTGTPSTGTGTTTTPPSGTPSTGTPGTPGAPGAGAPKPGSWIAPGTTPPGAAARSPDLPGSDAMQATPDMTRETDDEQRRAI